MLIRMKTSRDKPKFLQVRMSEDERVAVDDLAAEYGMDASNFIRAMVAYVDQYRPTLRIAPLKKETAPA